MNTLQKWVWMAEWLVLIINSLKFDCGTLRWGFKKAIVISKKPSKVDVRGSCFTKWISPLTFDTVSLTPNVEKINIQIRTQDILQKVDSVLCINHTRTWVRQFLGSCSFPWWCTFLDAIQLANLFFLNLLPHCSLVLRHITQYICTLKLLVNNRVNEKLYQLL